MSEITVRIKLVAIADTQLKMGEEIDAEITIPEHGGIHTKQIHDSLVMMFAVSHEALGYAAAQAMKKVE
jgi:hypothetical protein